MLVTGHFVPVMDTGAFARWEGARALGDGDECRCAKSRQFAEAGSNGSAGAV